MSKRMTEWGIDQGNKHNSLSKLAIIIFFIFYSYILYHHVINGLYVERFEGYFLSVVELYLHNKTALDQFAIFPFFDPNINIDPQLPTRIGEMKLSESYYPNFFVLFICTSLLTGLKPQLLLTIPLGLFFIPLLYFVIIRSFIAEHASIHSFPNTIWFLFTYYVIYVGVTRYYGSFYIAPIALGLILTSLFLIKKILALPDSRYILLMGITLVSLIYYWHSAFMQLFYIISAIFIVSLLLLHLEKRGMGKFDRTNLLSKRVFYLFLFSSVLGIAFSQLWRNDYFEIFISEGNLIEFVSCALQKFWGQVPFYVPYVYNYKELFWGKVYFASLQLILFVSFAILVISLLAWLRCSICEKRLIINFPIIFGLSIALAQIMLVLSYYKTNSLNLPLIPLYFPIFGIAIALSISRTFNGKFIRVNGLRIAIFGSLCILIALSLLCNISLNLTNEAGSTSITKYADAKQSFYWLNEKATTDNEVIVDFNIIGIYGQLESTGSFFNLKYLDLSPAIYQVIVGDIQVSPKMEGKFIVVDHATMRKGLPIHTVFNRAFLKEQISRIENCPNQSKLYVDKCISIYQFI